MDRGAWWATVYGVAKSQIQLKWLSTHTRTCNYYTYTIYNIYCASQVALVIKKVLYYVSCRCSRHKRCRFNPWVGKIPWSRKWQPLQYSCLKNPMDKRAWQARVHGVAKSQTWLRDRAHTLQGRNEGRQWRQCSLRARSLALEPEILGLFCVTFTNYLIPLSLSFLLCKLWII